MTAQSQFDRTFTMFVINNKSIVNELERLERETPGHSHRILSEALKGPYGSPQIDFRDGCRRISIPIDTTLNPQERKDAEEMALSRIKSAINLPPELLAIRFSYVPLSS